MSRLPKGVRKYIRGQKARLRRQFVNPAEYRVAVIDLYSALTKK